MSGRPSPKRARQLARQFAAYAERQRAKKAKAADQRKGDPGAISSKSRRSETGQEIGATAREPVATDNSGNRSDRG
jgi:hypothetical protein